MELDKYKNDGSFLLGTSSGLLTTDGKTTSTLVSFYVAGFAQVNTTHVVVADHRSFCLRMLNRKDNSSKVMAGSCGNDGYKEGGVGVGRMRSPYGVHIDVRNPGKLLVADEFNHALRSVDMETGELSTVIQTNFKRPRSLVWAGENLLIANWYNDVSQVSWSSDGTVSNTLLAGALVNGADVIGSLDVARFASPHDVEKVTDNLYLVADFGNRKLKLMDMKRKIVGPVCFKGEDPCTESSLLPHRPCASLNVGGAIYVGMVPNIYKLSGA